MTINGSTKIIGVIGNPIEHSISPQIHNAISKRLNKNIVYVPFKVNNENLKEAIDGAKALGILGLNITIPYKQKVIEHLIFQDEFSKKINAVNTLKLVENGFIGYNTDLYGMEQAIKDINISNSTVAIVGAGGAAYSAAIMAAKNGAQKIYLFNRTNKNAYTLAEHINKYYNVVVKVSELQNINMPIKLCIQTTPVGMENIGKDEHHLLNELESKLHYIENIFDLIYMPRETPLIKKARSMGISAVNGFGMLLHQAFKSYEIWFDIELSSLLKEQVIAEISEIYYGQ